MIDRAGDAAPDAARAFVCFMVARGAFGLALLGASLRRFPIPWYYPLERRWALEAVPHGLAMGWFGATLAASLAAAAGAAMTLLALRSPRVAEALSSRRTVLALARASGFVILIDFVYFGWTMMHQAASPLSVECGRALVGAVHGVGPVAIG